MNKNTLANIKCEWKNILNDGNGNTINFLSYIIFSRKTEKIMKSLTPLSNKIKLKNSIYDYNYILLWSIDKIKHDFENILLSPNEKYKPVTYPFLQFIFDQIKYDKNCDIPELYEKICYIQKRITHFDYNRIH